MYYRKKGIGWIQFRDKFNSFGGDGFYAAWQNPYNEKIIKSGGTEKEMSIFTKTRL